jgi:hypothetical protein
MYLNEVQGASNWLGSLLALFGGGTGTTSWMENHDLWFS